MFFTCRKGRSIRSEIVDVDAFDQSAGMNISDSEHFNGHHQEIDDYEQQYLEKDDHQQHFYRDNGTVSSQVYVDASSEGISGTDDTGAFGKMTNSQRYRKKNESNSVRSSGKLNRYATARERRLSVGSAANAFINGNDGFDNNGEITNGTSTIKRTPLSKLTMLGGHDGEAGQLVSMFGNEIACTEHNGVNNNDLALTNGSGVLLTATAKVLNGTGSNSAPPASVYCTVCYAALCRQCAQKSQHAQHSIVSLDVGAKRRMHEMQATCREIDERTKDFEEMLHTLVKQNKELKRHRAGVKSQIQATCNRLVNAISLRTEQLMQVCCSGFKILNLKNIFFVLGTR